MRHLHCSFTRFLQGVKYILVIPLMLIMAALATMLPLRPAYKELARGIMKGRLERQLREKDRLRETVLVRADLVASDAWERDEEFRLDGKLYDVVDIVYQNGRKYYRCVNDDVETHAEKAADELVKELAASNPYTPKGKLAKALTDWMKGLYCKQAPMSEVWDPLYVARVYAPAPANPIRSAEIAPEQEPPEA